MKRESITEVSCNFKSKTFAITYKSVTIFFIYFFIILTHFYIISINNKNKINKILSKNFPLFLGNFQAQMV